MVYTRRVSSRRASLGFLVLGVLPLLPACGGGLRHVAPSARTERATKPSVPVSDDAFAAALRDLLSSEPGSDERHARLGGVVGRQLIRADRRFQRGNDDRGVSATLGALYLMRTREMSDAALGVSERRALERTAQHFASVGDEGRARALYEILARVGGDQQKKQAQQHLAALKRWVDDTANRGSAMVRASNMERIAVARHLLEPSEEARTEAERATITWIERALALRKAYRTRRSPPPREDAAEAMRALQTGAITVACIHLRDADPAQALRALDRSGGRELARREFVVALEAAAEDPSAQNLLQVLTVLRPDESDDPRLEAERALQDQDLVRAAAFSIALEAYRLDPSKPAVAGAVAAALQEYEMSEASVAILTDAVAATKSTRVLSGALAIAMQAMVREVDAGDVSAARRAYVAAKPIIAKADALGANAHLDPSPDEVRGLMGEIEVRNGSLDRAKPLLERAKKGGAPQVLATLAKIERHEGHLEAAAGLLDKALSSTDAKEDPGFSGDLLLALAEIASARGDQAKAQESLKKAAALLEGARAKAHGVDRARIERSLAAVLDRQGKADQAREALKRALDAAPTNKRQVAATLGLVVGRALIASDVNAARDGLSRALAADLDDDDIVYIALWTHYAERIAHASESEEGAKPVFERLAAKGNWTARLAAFALGKLDHAALVKSASNDAERGEAWFYGALALRAKGDDAASKSALEEVLKTGGVELMETAFARDLLRGGLALTSIPVAKSEGTTARGKDSH